MAMVEFAIAFRFGVALICFAAAALISIFGRTERQFLLAGFSAVAGAWATLAGLVLVAGSGASYVIAALI